MGAALNLKSNIYKTELCVCVCVLNNIVICGLVNMVQWQLLVKKASVTITRYPYFMCGEEPPNNGHIWDQPFCPL